MLVKDLIEQLQQLEQSKEIYVNNEYGVQEILIQKVSATTLNECYVFDGLDNEVIHGDYNEFKIKDIK